MRATSAVALSPIRLRLLVTVGSSSSRFALLSFFDFEADSFSSFEQLRIASVHLRGRGLRQEVRRQFFSDLSSPD